MILAILLARSDQPFDIHVINTLCSDTRSWENLNASLRVHWFTISHNNPATEGTSLTNYFYVSFLGLCCLCNLELL